MFPQSWHRFVFVLELASFWLSLHVLASPAVLLAEILKYFLPKLVELHNYGSSVGTRNNEANLYLLNR